MKREMTEIDTEDVVVKDRLRTDEGDLSTLESSIRKLGVLCPIIIDRNNVLIAGGRRLRAARNAGLAKIAAIRLGVDYDSMTALDIRSDENLCRQPLEHSDLEQHIHRKKELFGGPARDKQTGGSWLRKLFSFGNG